MEYYSEFNMDSQRDEIYEVNDNGDSKCIAALTPVNLEKLYQVLINLKVKRSLPESNGFAKGVE